MRTHLLFLAATMTIATATVHAQQPEVVHSQVTTQTAPSGLADALHAFEQTSTPMWVGYSIPTTESRHGSWGEDGTIYLEHGSRAAQHDEVHTDGAQDHANLLIRLANGKIEETHVTNPAQRIDAGDLRFVWLTNISPEDSIATLKTIAIGENTEHPRDAAVFLIALHRSPAAMPALVSLAAPERDLSLREKAAFWLANLRGAEGFAALRTLARDNRVGEQNDRFREKLTFDLSLVKDPGAVDELVRMAREDASPRVRRQAQFWMAQKGGKLVAGALHQSAESDPDARIRRQAVLSISRLPAPQAATELRQLAETSKYPDVRKQAVFWLGQSTDPQALDYLDKLLKSPPPTN